MEEKEEENKIGNINSIETESMVAIKSEDSPFAESFYFIDYYDEKLIKKFIKSVEKLIRTSKEYKFYIEQLRTSLSALNKDSIQGNITAGDVDLEFHHYPLSLYDLVECVMYQFLADEKKINTFRIAKEVMKLHYEQKIGLVSLTKTNHELAHCGKLFLSKKQVFGNYQKFVEEYSKGISPTLKGKIEMMEQQSDSGVPTDFTGIYR